MLSQRPKAKFKACQLEFASFERRRNFVAVYLSAPQGNGARHCFSSASKIDSE